MRARGPIVVVAALGVVSIAAGFVRADDRSSRHASLSSASPREQTLVAIEREQRSLRSEVETLSAQETSAQRRMYARGRATYRLVRLGLLPVGGGFSSLLDHAFKVERAKRALDQDVAAYRSIGDRKVAALHKLNELEVRRAPLAEEREAMAGERAALDEADDLRRSFDRAFETSTGAGDYVAIYGGSLGGPSGPDTPSSSSAFGFRSMKGRLPFPIAGRAEIRSVRRNGASGPGLEMAAAIGTPVRAVYSGRVAFADRYDPFGQIVILDHGGHYYTLMGDLGSIDVRVGDDLSAGAKVGTVGAPCKESVASPEDPTNKVHAKGHPSALYFELRQGTSTIDPGPWLGL